MKRNLIILVLLLCVTMPTYSAQKHQGEVWNSMTKLAKTLIKQLNERGFSTGIIGIAEFDNIGASASTHEIGQAVSEPPQSDNYHLLFHVCLLSDSHRFLRIMI